jgi:peptide/nickel transport system permease protein
MSSQELEHLRAEYRLDRPIIIQYVLWLWDLFHGDLGKSIFYHENVGKLMLERFPVTLHLGLTAFILSSILGIFLGLIAAIRRGTWIDAIATTFANIGITIFVPWLGLLMMYIFGLRLGCLPIAGYTSPFENFWMSTKQAIMPIICLSVISMAMTARQMRSSVLEVIQLDYVRTAWAKGLKERVVILRHIFKNSLIPVITLLGILIGFVIAGSVLVETVFAIPGVGRLLVTSIFAQDYTVIQSGTLIIAVIILLSNLIVDITYGWLDPKIRYS